MNARLKSKSLSLISARYSSSSAFLFRIRDFSFRCFLAFSNLRLQIVCFRRLLAIAKGPDVNTFVRKLMKMWPRHRRWGLMPCRLKSVEN